MNKESISSKPYAWVPSLYLAEALPYVAVMVIATTMYKRLGLSNTDLALYTSWLYLPWVIKPLWSPFIAAVKTERWWVLLMQLLIGAGFAGIAFTLPTAFWLQGSLAFFWILAFASATHDIAADGLYILGLSTHDQSLYVGIRSTFYRIGNIVGQGLLVMLAGWLEKSQTISLAWSISFFVLAGAFIALWMWHNVALPKPKSSTTREEGVSSNLLNDFWLALKTFFTKPHIFTALLFMLLFRFPEGQLVKIANPFLLDTAEAGGLALSTEAVGFVYGTIGIIGLTIGGLLGGWCVSRHGLKRWLWPMVLSISLPDLVYVYLAFDLPSTFLIVNICVFIEQFGYGFGFTAYMLYLIYYSRGNYKTSHYALCTAFMALSMMIPGLFAGALQEAVGYKNFFLIVIAFCSVTFAVTSLLKIDPSFGKKEQP